MCFAASLASPGGDPFATSSYSCVLVDDVGSFTGANQSRGVRFLERFAEPGDRRSSAESRTRPAATNM